MRTLNPEYFDWSIGLGRRTGRRRLAWLALAIGLLSFTARQGRAKLARDYLVENWQTEAGLPQLGVRALAQTPDGYLWIGTFQGLARFDGIRFTSLTTANTRALVSESIFCLYSDRAGRLWIGSDEGGLFCREAGVIRAVNDADDLPVKDVRAICEDAAGLLWIGAREGLFYRRPGESAFHQYAGPVPLPSLRITSLAAGHGGELWVGTESGLTVLNSKDASPLRLFAGERIAAVTLDSHDVPWFGLDRKRGLATLRSNEVIFIPECASIKVHRIQIDAYGGFWLATPDNGVCLWDGQRLHRFASNSPMATADATAIFSDGQNNVWAGLETSGLWRLSRRKLQTLGVEDGLPINPPTAVLEDARGRVWVATWGRGVFRRGTERFEHEDPIDVVMGTSLAETSDGSVWVGSFGGRLERWRDGHAELVSLPTRGFRAMLVDRDDSLWLGTLDSGVEHFDWRIGTVERFTTTNGLAHNKVLCLAQDVSGAIWVGTPAGLNRIDVHHVSRFTTADGLPSNDVRALITEADGTVWIATARGGVTRLRHQQFRTVGLLQGLTHDLIGQFVLDDFGYVWMASLGGILRVRLSELHACADDRLSSVYCLTLTRADGMRATQTGSGFQPCAMKARDGRLWFCTDNGMVTLDPRDYLDTRFDPKIQIVEVTIEGAQRQGPGTIDVEQLDAAPIRSEHRVLVPPGGRRFEIRYTAPELSSPHWLRFRYRLDGLDAGWREAGSERVAIYNRLPPGRYRFRVIACDAVGAWHEPGASLAVIVLPSFWQTWWFRALVGVSVAGLLYGLHRLRIARLEGLMRMRHDIASDLHDDVGGNLASIALNSELLGHASEASLEQRQELALINDTAVQTAQSVRDIVWLTNPGFDDLAHMAERMRDTAALLLAGKEYSFTFSPAPLPALPLELTFRRNAFLAYKETLANVARHSAAARVEIDARFETGFFRFTVRDNGRGFTVDKTSARGHGLKSLRRRATELRGEVKIDSTPGQGTRVEFSVPLRPVHTLLPQPT